jgi:hypothetical protein
LIFLIFWNRCINTITTAIAACGGSSITTAAVCGGSVSTTCACRLRRR